MQKSTLSIVFLILIFTVTAVDAEQHPQFIVHLETGAQWDASLPPGEQHQFAAHSANMRQLREEGVILFGARYEDYGLLIINAETADAARAILDADPGVVAGIFQYRLAPIRVFYPWKEGAE